MNAQDACTPTSRPTSAEYHAMLLALQGYLRVWQETAEGESLLNVTAPVGLVIADIAEALGLTSQDKSAMLGKELDAAVSEFADQQIRLKH